MNFRLTPRIHADLEGEGGGLKFLGNCRKVSYKRRKVKRVKVWLMRVKIPVMIEK